MRTAVLIGVASAAVCAAGALVVDVTYLAKVALLAVKTFIIVHPQPTRFAATFKYNARVALSDIDTFLHMNNARYLRHADFARMDFLAATGLLRALRTMNTMVVAGAATLRFRRELRLFQRFEIRTRVVGWDERSIFIQHLFVTTGGSDHGGDELRATMFVRWHLAGGNKSSVTVHEVMEEMGLDDAPPTVEPPSDVHQWLESTRDASVRVKYELDDAAA